MKVFPRVDDLVSIVPADLLGDGTACLVWSSALPGEVRRPMRYVNLMGGQKPHLLVKTVTPCHKCRARGCRADPNETIPIRLTDGLAIAIA